MNPCDFLAKIGFESLFAPLPNLSDEDDSRAEAQHLRSEHRRIANLLRDSPASQNKFNFGAQWMGRQITWPDRLPRLVTWSGNQTLGKIIFFRQEALGTGPIDDLFAFRAPMRGASGFDPVIALDSIDVGFSVNDLGLPVLQRPAVELLAIIGLQTLPLVSFSTSECGFVHDGQLWHMQVASRAGGYYRRWEHIVRRPDPVMGSQSPMPEDDPTPLFTARDLLIRQAEVIALVVSGQIPGADGAKFLKDAQHPEEVVTMVENMRPMDPKGSVKKTGKRGRPEKITAV